MPRAVKAAAPRKAPARKAPPKKAQPRKAPASAGDSLAKLYPASRTLWWFTSAAGTKIPLPTFSSLEAPSRRFFWELDQQPPLFQGFAWMRWAKVPVAIQSIVVDLPDDEYDALFDAWFDGADLTAGE